jgi:hypothetical protein
MKKPIITIFMLLIGLGLTSKPTSAQNAKFYALFMAKFTDYIQWPSSHDQIVIGVYGNPDIISELQKYALSKKSIAVIDITSVNDVQKCQLVFIADSKNSEFESINASIDGKNILLVTENDEYIKKGAGISFYLEGNKLRFKLNIETMDAKELKVGGSLLSLANVV